MGMSDCSECWETPCACGHEYNDYDIKRLTEMRDMFNDLIKIKVNELIEKQGV